MMRGWSQHEHRPRNRVEEVAQHNKQLESGVQATSIMESGVDGEDKPESTAVGETWNIEDRSEDPVMGYDFDDEIFGISRERVKLTRREKRISRRQYVGEPEACRSGERAQPSCTGAR